MEMKWFDVEISDRMREAVAISDRMRDATAISDRIHGALDTPMREALAISDRIQDALAMSEPMREALAISDRIHEGISEPMREALAISERMSEALSRSIGQPLGSLLPDLPEPIPYDPPALTSIPQRQTPAAETIERIVELWEQRRREIEGTNQDAFVKVTPPDGRVMLVKTLSAHGDNLIRISGHFGSGEEGSITVGATAFQVEIITLDRPAAKPNLRVVD